MKLRREQIILLKRANKSYKIIIKFFQYTVFVQANFSIGNCDVSQLIAANHHGITVIHCIVFYHSFLHWVFGIYNLWWISENSWMHQLSNTNLLGLYVHLSVLKETHWSFFTLYCCHRVENLSLYRLISLGSEVTRRFSWLPVIACLVQLKEPLSIFLLSIITNLWCMKKEESSVLTATPGVKENSQIKINYKT